MERVKAWGQSTAIDLYGCDKGMLTDPEKLKHFIVELCKKIKMKRHGDVHIDRFGVGMLEGYSAMQFIETSSITVHLDEYGKRAFIDVFSCRPFNAVAACTYAKVFFRARTMSSKTLMRGGK